MPQISTPRLQITEFTEGDLAFIMALVNSPKWLQYIGNRQVANETDALKYLNESILPMYKQTKFGLWKMCLKDHTPIGMCGLISRASLDMPDLGFALLPEFEGQGYAFEATKAVLFYAKNVLRMRELAAITLDQNISSKKLLKKLGFKQKKGKKVILEGNKLDYFEIKL